MNTQTALIGFIIIVLLGGGVYYFSMSPTDDAMENGSMMEKDEGVMEGAGVMEKNDDVMMEEEGAMMAHGGTYEAYAPEKIAWAKDGKVVLFFRAGWCPTCRALDADIRSKLSSIPKDVTILDVDYDTEIALRQKYGVTYQHTFVRVDASGNQVVKWSGSPTLAALLGNVK